MFTPPSSISPSPAGPKLVILATWLGGATWLEGATWLGGATSSRIAVYCRPYQSLYPSSPILLIRAVLSDITTKTFAALQTQQIPARDYLLSKFPINAGENASSTPLRPAEQALLHIFRAHHDPYCSERPRKSLPQQQFLRLIGWKSLDVFCQSHDSNRLYSWKAVCHSRFYEFHFHSVPENRAANGDPERLCK